MKAWACYWDDDWEWSILVLAETRGKAKKIFLAEIGKYEFTAVRTRRQPRWDGISDKPRAFMDNDELPSGLPPFYTKVQSNEESTICFIQGSNDGCSPDCEAYGSSDDCPIYEDECDNECVCGHCLHHESYPENTYNSDGSLKEKA